MTWHAVVSAGDLNEGSVLGAHVAGKHVAVYKVDGKLYASSNVCTHEFALLSDGYLEDGCIECPLHQAKFELATGKAMCAPATKPLPIYLVKEEAGQILVDLPD